MYVVKAMNKKGLLIENNITKTQPDLVFMGVWPLVWFCFIGPVWSRW